MPKHILIPTDGSELSKKAIQHGVAMAKTLAARVTGVTAKQPRAPSDRIDVVVRNRVVELWGIVTADHQREAATVAAENVAGVEKVANHLGRIEPASETAFPAR